MRHFYFSYKKYKTLFGAILNLVSLGLYGQGTTSSHIKWSTQPFDNQVFITNNGQFNDSLAGHEKILYASRLGYVWAYFTPKGIVYRYDKSYINGKITAGADIDDIKIRHKAYLLHAGWKEANPLVSIVAKDKKTDYYTYGKGTNGTIKASLFRQLTYKNIYPGVDAVYSFIKGKDGIKYTLIVYPGADLSKIKMEYEGNTGNISKDKDGDLLIDSPLGLFTEHAPVCNYKENNQTVSVSNLINKHVESFRVNAHYDSTKTLVIDPWITDPLFSAPGWDRAYDLDWDYHGNVYAYGGNVLSTMQFVKMNSAGVIQWTYNASYLSNFTYGDFCTDKKSGSSYLLEAHPDGNVAKVSTNGTLLGIFSGNMDSMSEQWRAAFDECHGVVVIGGGGNVYDNHNQAAILDTDLSSMHWVNILGLNTPLHDICLLTLDPNGRQCYMYSAKTIYPGSDNIAMQLPLPTLSPTAYRVHEQLGFYEVASVPYTGSFYGEQNTNGMNGAAASPNWLYLYNGDTIRRYHKNTGIYVSGKPVRAHSPFRYGGIDVDACDDIFAGVADSLYIMDSTYSIKTIIPLHDTVYDVHLGQNGAVYACGKGFVTQLTDPIPPVQLFTTSFTYPSSCSACNATATINPACGIAPYTFLWSDGSTNETDTGLCAGIHSFELTNGACPPQTDSGKVIINGKPGYTASVIDTNPGCPYTYGNIMVYPSGGVAPYIYSWSNGATTQKDTGLVAGTYTCTITDATGCKAFAVVNLMDGPTPNIFISPLDDSICNGGNVTLTASGGVSYNWEPHIGLSCYNCASPVASPRSTITYTVSGTDSAGCSGIATATIKVIPIPKITIAGSDSVCPGYADTLTASGGYTYIWSNAATTATIIINPAVTQTISVTAYNGACAHDTTFTIHAVNPVISIVTSADSVCAGNPDTLTAHGGSTYKWSNQSTSNRIVVNPNISTTYTVYSHIGACTDSATVTIGIFQNLTSLVSTKKDTICSGDSAHISALITGSISSYKWSNGATTSSISVAPATTTTYTATIYGKCDTGAGAVTIIVLPSPVPVITGDTQRCKGFIDTLLVSGGTSYMWSNGKTGTTYTTGQIKADSIIYVSVENNVGCVVRDSFKITMYPLPGVVITHSIQCTESPILLEPVVVGQGPLTYLWEPGGQTSDSIIVPDSLQTFTLTVSNKCATTTTYTLIPYFPPSLSACCNETIVAGDDTVLVASGHGIVRYQWQDSAGVICLNPSCDSVRVNPNAATTYTVTGTDSLGCQVERIITIDVLSTCFDFNVPNVFTPAYPGPYGTNNVFYIKAEYPKQWSVIIYDRWGKEMFNTTNPHQYWTGNTENGGQAPDGVYYYIIHATCSGTTYQKDGFLQLIR